MLTTVVALGGYLYLRLDDEVRRYAEAVLANHYEHLDVQLGGARFEAGRGVILRNLVVSQPNPSGELTTLAEVDELQLLGAFDFESLTTGKPSIDQIRLRSPRVYAVRDASGNWNVASLFPPPATGKHPADIEVVGAVIVMTDSTRSPARPLTLREVRLTANCIDQSPAADPTAPALRTYQVEAAVGGDVAEKFTVGGTVQTGTGALDSKVEVVGLDLSSPLVASLVGGTASLAKISGIHGKADMSLIARRPAGGPPVWQADFRVADGRLAIDSVPARFPALKSKAPPTKANCLSARLPLSLARRTSSSRSIDAAGTPPQSWRFAPRPTT